MICLMTSISVSFHWNDFLNEIADAFCFKRRFWIPNPPRCNNIAGSKRLRCLESLKKFPTFFHSDTILFIVTNISLKYVKFELICFDLINKTSPGMIFFSLKKNAVIVYSSLHNHLYSNYHWKYFYSVKQFFILRHTCIPFRKY